MDNSLCMNSALAQTDPVSADSFLLSYPPTFRAPQAPQGTCPAAGGQYAAQPGQISLQGMGATSAHRNLA